MADGWDNTAIWRVLSERADAQNACLVLQVVMPDIVTVLSQAATAASDFTLHDSAHSYRVAERSAELMGESGLHSSTDVELTLLLLACYLHDIGMTPERQQVQRHLDYLQTGSESALSAIERSSMGAWLDDTEAGETPPYIRNGQLDTQRAEAICTYYSRYKHNDWSEDWIRNHLSQHRPLLYPNWLSDLITLCRSHHEGLTALRSQRFNAKMVGQPSRVLNLRYLAAILRVADVTEFDPERTPSVLLSHRNVSERSKIFWHKDHAISFHLEPDGTRISLTARTPNAIIHRAVLQTAEQVDDELSVCSTLQHEGAFLLGSVPEASRHAYYWKWPARLNVDARPVDDSFEYIDGTFRPNTQRILRLLSGTQLYSSPFSAVREILQNACDAVKEQIALERLQNSNPGDSELARTLGALHSISISIEEEGGRYWLRCVDDGTGMSKRIIERYLLISGSSMRPEVHAIDRKATAHGFQVGRTGEFGIGVLSYFMIADYLEITTRRSLEAGDEDNTAWTFNTAGLTEFGQLSRASRSSKGTDVRLRLHQDLGWIDRDSLAIEISKYITNTLRFLPCRIYIRDEVNGGDSIVMGPGWTSSSTKPELIYTNEQDLTDNSRLLTNDEQADREGLRSVFENAVSSANEHLRWTTPSEFPLADGNGIVRVTIPFYELRDGPSVVFIDQSIFNNRHNGNLPYAIYSREVSIVSWMGFYVPDAALSIADFKPGLIEVDLRSGYSVSANRERFEERIPKSIAMAVKDAFQASVDQFLLENKYSRYNLINQIVLRPSKWILDGEVSWPGCGLDGALMEFRHVETPFAVSLLNALTTPHGALAHSSGDQIVAELHDITLNSYTNRVSATEVLGGGRLCHSISGSSVELFALWDSASPVAPVEETGFLTDFPPGWSAIFAARMPKTALVNRAHELSYCIEHAIRGAGKFEHDPQKAEFDCKSSAAMFLFMNLRQTARFWNALRDNRPEAFSLFVSYLTSDARTRIEYIFSSQSMYSVTTVQIDANGARERVMALTRHGLAMASGETYDLDSSPFWRLVRSNEQSADIHQS